MTASPGPATIRDVARDAGVSVATVSRVLSGSRPTGQAVAERVLESSRRLGFEVNQVARALRTHVTDTVGVVVPDIMNPFFPALLQAASHHLRTAGLGVLFVDAQGDPAIEAAAVQLLLARRVDGLLISPCDRRASLATVEAAAARVPLVQIDRRVTGELAHVGVDQDQAMRQVVDHLAARGGRHFAYLGSDDRISTSFERTRAFRRHVRRHDGEGAGRCLTREFSTAWGTEGGAALLRDHPEVDAVVCGNDEIAYGFLLACENARRRVPEDVAVLGFDDTLLARIARPAITSVRQPVEEIARRAVEELTRVRGGAVQQSVTVEPQLVVRASTAGPRPQH